MQHKLETGEIKKIYIFKLILIRFKSPKSKNNSGLKNEAKSI